MNNNSPQGKFLTFKTVGVVIFFPGKKGITIVICHQDRKSLYLSETGYPKNDNIAIYSLTIRWCSGKVTLYINSSKFIKKE